MEKLITALFRVLQVDQQRAQAIVHDTLDNLEAANAAFKAFQQAKEKHAARRPFSTATSTVPDSPGGLQEHPAKPW